VSTICSPYVVLCPCHISWYAVVGFSSLSLVNITFFIWMLGLGTCNSSWIDLWFWKVWIVEHSNHWRALPLSHTLFGRLILDKINTQVCLQELKECWTKARQKQLVLGLTNRCLIYKTRYTTVCSEMNKPQTLLLGGKFNRWKWNGGDSKSMPFWNKMVSKWGGMTKGKRNLPEGTSSILLHSHIAYVPDKYHLLRLLLSSGNSVWFWWYSNSRCWQGPS